MHSAEPRGSRLSHSRSNLRTSLYTSGRPPADLQRPPDASGEVRRPPEGSDRKSLQKRVFPKMFGIDALGLRGLWGPLGPKEAQRSSTEDPKSPKEVLRGPKRPIEVRRVKVAQRRLKEGSKRPKEARRGLERSKEAQRSPKRPDETQRGPKIPSKSASKSQSASHIEIS